MGRGLLGGAALGLCVLTYTAFASSDAQQPEVAGAPSEAPLAVPSGQVSGQETPASVPSSVATGQRTGGDSLRISVAGEASSPDALPPQIQQALAGIEGSSTLNPQTKERALAALRDQWAQMNAAPK